MVKFGGSNLYINIQVINFLLYAEHRTAKILCRVVLSPSHYVNNTVQRFYSAPSVYSVGQRPVEVSLSAFDWLLKLHLIEKNVTYFISVILFNYQTEFA